MADDARTLRRDLNRIVQQQRQTAADLATALAALAATTQRTNTAVAGPFAVGSVDLGVAWPLAWPDAGYGVWLSIVSGTAALGSLTATLKSGTKTPTGCVITVANTGSAAVGAFAIDVLGVRT